MPSKIRAIMWEEKRVADDIRELLSDQQGVKEISIPHHSPVNYEGWVITGTGNEPSLTLCPLLGP